LGTYKRIARAGKKTTFWLARHLGTYKRIGKAGKRRPFGLEDFLELIKE
jgi:hypothetical protein